MIQKLSQGSRIVIVLAISLFFFWWLVSSYNLLPGMSDASELDSDIIINGSCRLERHRASVNLNWTKDGSDFYHVKRIIIVGKEIIEGKLASIQENRINLSETNYQNYPGWYYKIISSYGNESNLVYVSVKDDLCIVSPVLTENN